MNIISPKGAFDIRYPEKGDLDYILSSWQRTWEQAPEWKFPGVIRNEYFRHAHLMLDELISRSASQGALYICHAPGAPYIIRGYLCGEVYTDPNIAYLHWVQVKKPEWQKGVAEALLTRFKLDFDVQPDQNILYTFGTKCLWNKGFGQKLVERHNLTYWPFFKWTSQPEGWEVH